MSNQKDLGKDSIGKLLLSLALPAIVAQLVNVLYNIVDRIFIGRMINGEIAMAGVGVAFPIIIIVSAFSYLVGGGGAPLCAIKMGEKDNDQAEKILSNSFSTLIFLSLVLTIFFFCFKEPILWAFGASDATIDYALDYLSLYILGTIFVQIALGMNPFINTQGFAKFGMMTVMIGAIINIILDPIFIFVFNMGVKGAALATLIGQMASAIWVLCFLFGKKSILKIQKKYLFPDFKVIFKVLSLGLSPFIMQVTESLVLISLNTQLSLYGGDLAVGAMTIMSSIMQMILLPIQGITQGAQPIISYNFGARQIDRVKKTIKLTLGTCLIFSMFVVVSLISFPSFFVNIFNDDPELLSITIWSIRIYFLGISVFGLQVACQQTFLALGQVKISIFMAILRKIVLLLPLIFILPHLVDNQLLGVLMAEPVADFTATLVTFLCFIFFYKKELNTLSQ